VKGIAYELVGDTYQLTRAVVCLLPDELTVKKPVRLGHVSMMRSILRIDRGFQWDGASGPAIDTPNFMRASLIHDALYGLGAKGLLPAGWRRAADRVLYLICREDGMSWFRAQYVWAAVRLGGWTHV